MGGGGNGRRLRRRGRLNLKGEMGLEQEKWEKRFRRKDWSLNWLRRERKRKEMGDERKG